MDRSWLGMSRYMTGNYYRNLRNVIYATLACCFVCITPCFADPVNFALAWSSSKTAHHPQAVDKLVFGFFNPDGSESSEDNSSKVTTIGGLSGSLSNPNIKFIKIGKNEEIQFSISSTLQKMHGFNLRYSLEFSQGRSSYFLPDGIKPFLDPMTLTIKHQTAQIEAITVHQLSDFDVFVGAGLVRTWSQSRLTSALLDVPSRDTFTSIYTTAGFDYLLDKSPLSIGAKVNRFTKGQFSLETRLRIAF